MQRLLAFATHGEARAPGAVVSACGRVRDAMEQQGPEAITHREGRQAVDPRPAREHRISVRGQDLLAAAVGQLGHEVELQPDAILAAGHEEPV